MGLLFPVSCLERKQGLGLLLNQLIPISQSLALACLTQVVLLDIKSYSSNESSKTCSWRVLGGVECELKKILNSHNILKSENICWNVAVLRDAAFGGGSLEEKPYFPSFLLSAVWKILYFKKIFLENISNLKLFKKLKQYKGHLYKFYPDSLSSILSYLLDNSLCVSVLLCISFFLSLVFLLMKWKLYSLAHVDLLWRHENETWTFLV